MIPVATDHGYPFEPAMLLEEIQSGLNRLLTHNRLVHWLGDFVRHNAIQVKCTVYLQVVNPLMRCEIISVSLTTFLPCSDYVFILFSGITPDAKWLNVLYIIRTALA